MGKKENEEAKGKITKSAKAAKPEKPAEPSFEEQILAAMRQSAENGIVEVTSRLVSDKLGFEDPDKGRNKIRNVMRKLEADGKVVIAKKKLKEKAREQYVYSLKESK